MDELTHLLVQATGGDRDALSDFVRSSQADVWRFCSSMLSVDQADDATQETFVRAWRAAPAFRGESSARTWLLAIAKRVCYDAMRRRTRTDRKRDRLIAQGGPFTTADPSDTLALTDLVDGLDPDRRSAFVLTQVLGLSYEEAAEAAGCPIGTIRSRVARARGDLQDALAAAERRPDGSRAGG